MTSDKKTLNTMDDNDLLVEAETDEELPDAIFDINQNELKPYDPTQIRVDPKTFSLRNVLDMIDDKELDLAPDFQRMRVWSLKQKSRLIESILLRIPLPAFYFSSNSSGFMQVVDGVQRLSTIYDFVRNNEFYLQHLEYLNSELGNLKYSDLEGTVWAKRINSTQITVNVIDPQTPSKVKFDIFKRINTGGTPLNSQEIRHCMSGTRTRDLLEHMTSLESFNEATNWTLAGHIRMVDKELALRWVAFTLLDQFDYEVTLKYETLEDLLNSTSERIEGDKSLDIMELIFRFDKAMKMADEIFSNLAFRKVLEYQEKKFPINKALFEAWSVSLGRYVEFADILISNRYRIQSLFEHLCTWDQNFMSSITVGTGNTAKVRYRHWAIDNIIKQVINA